MELKIIPTNFKDYDSIVAITESIDLGDVENSSNYKRVLNQLLEPDVPEKWNGLAYEFPAATVVFDLAGSSVSIREKGAKDYVIKNQEIFSELTNIIYQNKGIIEKFPGDGISIHFPLMGDETEKFPIRRAFRAIDFMDRYLRNEQGLDRTNYRFTLTYGDDTIITKFGNRKHMEIISIGHAVNVAHKMEKYVKGENCCLGIHERCRPYLIVIQELKKYTLDSELCKDPNIKEEWYGVKYK